MKKNPEATPQRRFLWLKILVIAMLIVLAIAISSIGIRFSQGASRVNAVYAEVQKDHPGEKVEALIAYLQSETHPPYKKDSVVWILGELRDQRALPVLQALVTGEKCDHSKIVCQKTLGTAIHKLTGEIRNPPYLWRKLLYTTMPCTRQG